MQRRKGRRYEQDIANVFREWWPSAVVRRASQAERADNPDVFVADGPPLLKRLWLELTDSRAPNPSEKLWQAERDIAHRVYHRDRLPVVVWHRLRERESHVTTRLWVLDVIRGVTGSVNPLTVTMTLDDFILFARANVARATQEAC